MIEIREIRVADAEQFLALCHQLDRESTFMMLEPDERSTSLDEQRSAIQHILESRNSTTILAEDEGSIVGYVAAYGGVFRRNRHSASIVVGITRSHAGKGIGTRLFAALLEWATAAEVTRLELTVMMNNSAAIALYRKMGFVDEGVRRHSLVVDGSYVDELAMARVADA